MKIKKNVLVKDGKEIVIAASAAMSLGIYTSLTHQALIHADTVNTTETSTTSTGTTLGTVVLNSSTNTPTITTTPTTSSNATSTSTSQTSPNTAISDNSVSSGTTATNAATSTNPTNSNTTDVNAATSSNPTNSGITTTNTATSSNATGSEQTTPPTTDANTAASPNSTTQTSNSSGSDSTTDQTAPATSNTSDTSTPADVDQYTPSDSFTWTTDSTNGTATVTGLAQGASAVTSINLPPTVTINGVTYNVTAVGDNAFQFNNNLTSITFNDGLTSIGKEAFYSNENLTSVIFNNGLESIGEGAFAYDAKLATVDFSKNSTLQTIGDNAFTSAPIESLVLPDSVISIGTTAFAYNDSLTTLTLPASLQTIGDQAFASNRNLQSVIADKSLVSIGYQSFIYDNNLTDLDLTNDTSLQTIGAGAFEYDKVSGDLTFPASVTSIGDQAFLSNQLTGINYSGNSLTLGNETFKYNRIVNITAPNISIFGNFGSGIGGYQVDTIFTDPTKNNISDFFNLDVDGYGEQYLGVFGLTNGVTYSNGVFDIPTGTTSFSFNWSIGSEYNGQYNVVLNNPVIKAIDSIVVIGSDWSPDDNFIGCTLSDGTVVPLSSMTISIKDPNGNAVSTVDTQTPGDYQVTYSYGTYSTTVDVNVQKNAGTYDLTGTNSSVYNGEPQTINGSYQVTLSNGVTYTTKPGDVEFVSSPAINAGTYQVQLSAQGLAAINQLQGSDLYNWELGTDDANYLIEKLPITITANNASKEAGTSDPILTGQVSNGVTDAVYTVSRAPGESVGTYPITVTYTSESNPNYEITVNAGTFTITGIDGTDYTMNVGDPAPTVSDFQAIAYDVNGPVSDISLNLNGADLTKNGDYTVTLSTADGMTKQVVLHVTGEDDSVGPTDPDEPDEPSNPDEPENPTNPIDPSDPDEPTDPEDPEDPTGPDNPTDTNESDGSTEVDEPQEPDNSIDSDNSEGSITTQASTDPSYSEDSINNKGSFTTNTPKIQDEIITEGSKTDSEETNVSNKGLITPVSTPNSATSKLDNPFPVSSRGKLPQTGDKTGLMAMLSGILLGSLSLIGIDLKHRKNNR
ncbi:leucine-rich repeat protein [Companilactobacillus baiquanensis]|uniref:Leucine-rich repeat protein n=1 Tax=Companilactobacillus baiquanensis TaxID=2486005 RepID=A0ABW1UUB1_9LACO|nr:leucine-rich repeat protein [Companilactobacillus baiquanensis]